MSVVCTSSQLIDEASIETLGMQNSAVIIVRDVANWQIVNMVREVN